MMRMAAVVLTGMVTAGLLAGSGSGAHKDDDQRQRLR